MNKVDKNQKNFQGLSLVQYLTLLIVLVNLFFLVYCFLNYTRMYEILVPTSPMESDKLKGSQQSRTSASSIEIVTLIESLKPKTTINIKKEVRREQDILYIGFWVENIGKHELVTSTKALKLSNSPFGEKNTDKANVKITYINPPSVILSGEKQEQQFRIDLSGYNKKSIFYSLQMESIPNPTIEKAVRKLASSFGIKIPDTFFILNSTRVGAISL